MAKLYQLTRQQIIPASIEKVWEFFSNPKNLNALTPPAMQFRIENEVPEKIYPGLIIAYTIRITPLFRVHWVTEIRHLTPEAYFVDEQRSGPYRFWYHEHRFEKVPEGVRMTDAVHYQVGYGWLGSLLHRVWIRPKLEFIFRYRYEAVKRIFYAE